MTAGASRRRPSPPPQPSTGARCITDSHCDAIGVQLFFWFPTATDSYTYSPYDPYPSPQTTNPACSLPLELCEPSTSLPRSTTRPSGPAWECVGRVCGGIHKGSLLPTGFTVEGICGSIFLPFPPQLGPCPTALSSPAHFLVFCRVISFPPQFLN